ncbi:MAG TPA: ABC transporter ATP-binding protein [Stellaceae bacterium]|nr:ABC transporter ATP-binding protein [Stellaceae bacterium]
MSDVASSSKPVALIARYLWRHRIAHAVVILAILGAVAASVAARYSMKFLVDTMTADHSHMAGVWQAVAIFTACVGADNVLWRVAGWAGAGAFPAIGAELRLDLFRHLLGQSSRYFNERFSGALAGRVTTAATGLFTLENLFTWNVLPAAAATLGAVIGLGTVRWEIAAALAAAAVVVGVGIAFAALRAGPLNHLFAERAAEVSGDIVDAVTNHGIVRVFANRRRESARLQQALAGETEAHRRALVYIERLRLAHAMAVWVISGAVLAWSVELWAGGTITAGDVVVCGSFALALLQSSRDLAVALVDTQHHWSRVSEAVATLTVPHDMPDRADSTPFRCRGGMIVLDNVSFGHDHSHITLENVNLRVPAGQSLGVVGPSGAGKSTLLALLQRLYPASQGRILIDDQDIASLQQESLRRAIAVVPQDISLFHRSVLENIRYGRPDATDAEVKAAARAARCEQFIARLPEGYDTLVGERGVRLSVGQKQRVAIARALLTDAPIILLDEATSALDTESEVAIQQALSELMRGRTLIAVAHRLSTIAGFDRVIVIDEGRIIEDGPPAQLRHRRGTFARLWQAQTDDTAREAMTEEWWSRLPPPLAADAAQPKAVANSTRR